MIKPVRTPPPGLRAASDWLEARSRREQFLIGGLCLLMVVAMLWYGIAQPLIQARETAELRISTAAELTRRLASVSPDTPPGPGALDIAPLSGTLVEVVTRRAGDAGLSPSRIEPDQEGQGAEITIDKARYDAVMTLISALEGGDGITINHLNIVSTGEPGMVRLQMQVQGS